MNGGHSPSNRKGKDTSVEGFIVRTLRKKKFLGADCWVMQKQTGFMQIRRWADFGRCHGLRFRTGLLISASTAAAGGGGQLSSTTVAFSTNCNRNAWTIRKPTKRQSALPLQATRRGQFRVIGPPWPMTDDDVLVIVQLPYWVGVRACWTGMNLCISSLSTLLRDRTLPVCQSTTDQPEYSSLIHVPGFPLLSCFSFHAECRCLVNPGLYLKERWEVNNCLHSTFNIGSCSQ